MRIIPSRNPIKSDETDKFFWLMYNHIWFHLFVLLLGRTSQGTIASRGKPFRILGHHVWMQSRASKVKRVSPPRGNIEFG